MHTRPASNPPPNPSTRENGETPHRAPSVRDQTPRRSKADQSGGDRWLLPIWPSEWDAVQERRVFLRSVALSVLILLGIWVLDDTAQMGARVAVPHLLSLTIAGAILGSDLGRLLSRPCGLRDLWNYLTGLRRSRNDERV